MTGDRILRINNSGRARWQGHWQFHVWEQEHWQVPDLPEKEVYWETENVQESWLIWKV